MDTETTASSSPSFDRLVHQRLEPIVLRALLRLRAWLPPESQLALQLSDNNSRIRTHAHQLEDAIFGACVAAHQSIQKISDTLVVEVSNFLMDDIVLDTDAQKLQGGLPPRQYVRILVSNSVRVAVTPLHTLVPTQAKAETQEPLPGRLKLAQIQSSVEQHGGYVSLSRQAGRGIEVSLYLPTVIPLQSRAATSDEVVIKEVIYVDDYKDMRDLVGETLPDAGFRVTCYETPQQALSALIINPMVCDVLVCDYRLRGSTGIDLLREAKKIRPDLPVVIISGYVDEAMQFRAMGGGAAVVLSKENDLSELCITLNKLLGNEPHPALVTYSEWGKL